MKKYKPLLTLTALMLTAAVLLPSCASKSDAVSSDGLTELSGEPVSEDIYSGYKLTMVNVWATFCSPCLSEMPELGEISTEYADKGLQIIGVPVDVVDSDGNVSSTGVEYALDLITETHASYLHVLPSDKLGLELDVQYVPTTYFVDKDGNTVGETYVGAKTKDEWTKIIDGLLSELS